MKKSDKKQYEKAWDCFNEGWKAFMSAMLLMDELDESDYSIQEKRGYTPLGTRRPQKWAAVDDC